MASSGEQQQPIIVVKKKGGHGGHHGGAWKVAYADFVTAMMAFFLVMWLVTQDSIIKENVAGYFNNPSGWGKGPVGQGTNSILKGGDAILKQSVTSPLEPRTMTESRAREVLRQAGERISDALSGLPDFESIKEHVDMELTEEGLRIELIEASSTSKDSAYFFAIGSAEFSDKGRMILTAIAREISKISNNVVIEGHTDSRQYIYKDKYSNWELSADRANSARKLMESTGVKDGQIGEIRGYAYNRLKFPENPFDPRNRRISILVLTDLSGAGIQRMEFREMVGGQVVKEINKTE
jgi:chemotaxis protein MotB